MDVNANENDSDSECKPSTLTITIGHKTKLFEIIYGEKEFVFTMDDVVRFLEYLKNGC